MNLSFEVATPDDEQTIRKLYAEAVEWIAEKGSDQWQPAAMAERQKSAPAHRHLSARIARGEVYIVRDGSDVVGTITLDDYADPEFWGPDDEPASALYVHRMIVSRSAAGRDIGAVMLEWAAERAAGAGLTRLRLDAWRTNPGLHAYYQRHGFTHVRTVNVPGRGSGSLFERGIEPSKGQV